MDLDGETNLKRKESHAETNAFTNPANQLESKLSQLTADVTFDFPNTNLNKFNASIKLKAGSKLEFPLNNKNLLLRGCTVRNTDFAVGLVVYTGHDTKVMKNLGKTRFKRTELDYQMNVLIYIIAVMLFTLAGIGSIVNAAWLRDHGLEFIDAYNWFYTKYTGDDAWYNNERFEDPDTIAGLNFLSYIIVLNTLIPLSLYVCIEFIRAGQSIYIYFDAMMFDSRTSEYAKPWSTTLCENLGQIDYVFSDKTGTLTQNVMEFQQCSVGGTVFGVSPAQQAKDMSTLSSPTTQQPTRDRLSAVFANISERWSQFNSGIARPTYIDNEFLTAVETNPQVHQLFRLISICHTVRPDEVDGKIEYMAESPDEKALVDAARDLGFKFINNLEDKVVVELRSGETERYDILDIIEFDSTRKRMSVICRDHQNGGSIRLFSKGADSIMFARLKTDGSQEAAKAKMLDHLTDFAKSGLRTLVMAQRDIPIAEYKEWAERMSAATKLINGRDEAVAQLSNEIEVDMELVGATAIEDKLQDEVPVTIAKLKEAGMKVWVLTGDKLETAINIGASCELLTPEMKPFFQIDGDSYEEVREQIARHKKELAERRKTPFEGQRFAMVITGPALLHPLPPDQKEINDDAKKSQPVVWTDAKLGQQKELEAEFLALAKQCSAVVCCRVSPLQKAKVVRAVKENEDAVTLAIGDGANDVSMIKEAHIGIGISGLEGRQAVLASDYSIGQFKFLGRLLLVHGRYSYLRMCAFLRYFFYKNFAFTVCQLWYAFYNGGSAMTNFDDVFISFFNVTFCTLPIMIVGIYEQDVSPKLSMQYPMLYQAGPMNKLFSYGGFFFDLLTGVVHSLVVFFTFYLMLNFNGTGGASAPDGTGEGGIYMMGMFLSWVLIVMVNVQLAVTVLHWNYGIFLSLLFGPVCRSI